MDSLLQTQETGLKVYANYGNHRGGLPHADEAIRSEFDHFVRRPVPSGLRESE